MIFFYKKFLKLLVVPGVLLCASCTTKSELRLEKFSTVTQKGDFITAANDIKSNPKMYGKTNRFLYYMDVGMLYHYGELFDSSITYLQKASDTYDELFSRSVTNEAASLLTNDNIRPYRSKPYELVLAHQILAFDYMGLLQPDEALVEGRKTQLLFNEWERKNVEDNRYFTDGMFHYVTSILYDGSAETDNAMISLYKSLQAFNLGPVPCANAIKRSAVWQLLKNDRAADLDLLKINADTADLKPFEKFTNGQSEIVVVGFAGKGPTFIEEEWWGDWVKDGVMILHHSRQDGPEETMSFPAPGLPEEETRKAERGRKTRSGTTLFIKVALPQVKTFPSQTASFSVEGQTLPSRVTTSVISDYDLQAQKQLSDARSATIVRTIVRVVLRTLAAQKAKEEMQTSSPIANLLINIGTDVVSGQLEKADTRSCFLVPKTVQIARIPVKSGTYTFSVTARDGSGNALSEKFFSNLQIRPGEKKFVFVTSFR